MRFSLDVTYVAYPGRPEFAHSPIAHRRIYVDHGSEQANVMLASEITSWLILDYFTRHGYGRPISVSGGIETA